MVKPAGFVCSLFLQFLLVRERFACLFFLIVDYFAQLGLVCPFGFLAPFRFHANRHLSCYRRLCCFHQAQKEMSKTVSQ